MVEQINVERQWSEKAVLLGPDKCQLSQLHLDLRNLPRNSSDEDKFQVSKARDKNAEISEEKVATTALNALQQLSWLNAEKTSEQCFQPLLLQENQKAVRGETEIRVRG